MCVCVCVCVCVSHQECCHPALTQDNMCESLPIAYLSLFIATPHSESTQAVNLCQRLTDRTETEGERGDKGWGGDQAHRKRKGIEQIGKGEEAGRERGDVRRGGKSVKWSK